MTFSNNNNYVSNTYLKFFKWVADEMQSNCLFIGLAMLLKS